jgi:hypothetical protein
MIWIVPVSVGERAGESSTEETWGGRRTKDRGHTHARGLASGKVLHVQANKKVKNARGIGQRDSTARAAIVNSKAKEGSAFRTCFEVEQFRKTISEMLEVGEEIILHSKTQNHQRRGKR